jgi:hypothetical protein
MQVGEATLLVPQQQLQPAQANGSRTQTLVANQEQL